MFVQGEEVESWYSLPFCLQHRMFWKSGSCCQLNTEQHPWESGVIMLHSKKKIKSVLQIQNYYFEFYLKQPNLSWSTLKKRKKKESWVAIEITNVFLWTWMSWAKLGCLHNLFCGNNIPHAYFSLKRNSTLSGILDSMSK